MAKVVDITDKLSFEVNPSIKIKEEMYAINADAKTVLEIMGLFNDERDNTEAAFAAYEKLFSEKDRKKLNKLPFKDLMTVISSAMQLVTGNAGEDSPRE